MARIKPTRPAKEPPAMSDFPPSDRPVVMSSGDVGNRRGPASKPTAATLAEIFVLVGALWALAWGLTLGTAFLFSFAWCCLPVPLFMFIVSIFALVDSIRMLTGRRGGKPRIFGLLFLIGLLSCDVLTVLCGVVILILCDMPSAKAWYGDEPLIPHST
jgi:hypothetical protein